MTVEVLVEDISLLLSRFIFPLTHISLSLSLSLSPLRLPLSVPSFNVESSDDKPTPLRSKEVTSMPFSIIFASFSSSTSTSTSSVDSN